MTTTLRTLFVAATLASAVPSLASPPVGHHVPIPRERPAVVNRILEQRLDGLLPRLMTETGIDMWLVIAREYTEDPVFFTLAPEPVHAARRTTMLVFSLGDDGSTVERLTVSRYPFGELYEAAWEGGDLDEQWERLAEIVAERDPETIGIDVSEHWPLADGLTASLRDRLESALPRTYRDRLESAEELVVRWLESRTDDELAVWPHLVGIAREVIAEAFSNRTITPGVTTTGDVEWAIADAFARRDLAIWFHPSVDVQRRGDECEADSPSCGSGERTIRPGDVLHTDVGICVLRLCTDTQEMGYVLRLEETAPPPGLEKALATGLRWQDLLTGVFGTGKSGNRVLADALAAAEEAGIVSSVYSHPLGFYGHGPGPTIGMWDDQGAIPVRGDWPLYPSTGYAIEGNVKVSVPEWDGQIVQIKLEQSAVFDGREVRYLAGRQTGWHLVTP